MADKYMHIDYQPNASWLLTIMTKLHRSPSATLRDRMKGWGDSSIREMGFSLSTKLALLPLVVRQLEDDFQRLGKQLNDDGRVQQCVQTGSAYPVADKKLAFKIVADVDSFLFESRSAYEIVGRFLKEFFHYVLDKKIDEGVIRDLLELRGLDTKWIDELREKRIEFFHKTAPWVAVRIVSEQPLSFGLVVMKKDIKNFTNRDDYFHNRLTHQAGASYAKTSKAYLRSTVVYLILGVVFAVFAFRTDITLLRTLLIIMAVVFFLGGVFYFRSAREFGKE